MAVSECVTSYSWFKLLIFINDIHSFNAISPSLFHFTLPILIYLYLVWIIFVIPTLTVAFDFVLVTLFSKGLFIDHMHYVAQLLWVSANILWAFGEIYYPENDYPFSPGTNKQQ